MKINLQKISVILLAVTMFSFMSACGEKPELDLPPLPTYSDETPLPTHTVKPSVTPSVMPSSNTASSKSASPLPDVVASPSSEPSPLPTVESDVPVLTISEVTLPEDMLQYNVSSLRGLINVDKGSITYVSAMLADGSGNAVQSCYFQPMLPNFSLGGTVNAQLQFALLPPGTYCYILEAKADNNGISTQRELINHAFTVYATQEEMNNASSGESKTYSDKISIDSSNAAELWNFLVVYLDNPYGAAGVLANIEVESGCDPVRVQGDLSDDCSFSHSYTEQVDAGTVSRSEFIGSVPAEGYGSGYGLCQWTLERKEGLYDLAKKNETSVGDLNTQCTYLVMELEMNYPKLAAFLRTTDDAKAAAKEFFYVFEQGTMMGDRADIALAYLEEFAK